MSDWKDACCFEGWYIEQYVVSHVKCWLPLSIHTTSSTEMYVLMHWLYVGWGLGVKRCVWFGTKHYYSYVFYGMYFSEKYYAMIPFVLYTPAYKWVAGSYAWCLAYGYITIHSMYMLNVRKFRNTTIIFFTHLEDNMIFFIIWVRGSGTVICKDIVGFCYNMG